MKPEEKRELVGRIEQGMDRFIRLQTEADARKYRHSIVCHQSDDEKSTVCHRSPIRSSDLFAAEINCGRGIVERVLYILRQGSPGEIERMKSDERSISYHYEKLRSNLKDIGPRVPFDDESRLEMIRDMTDRGSKSTHIAKRIGVSSRWVKEIAKANGIILVDWKIPKNAAFADVNGAIESTVRSSLSLSAGFDFIVARIHQVDNSRLRTWITDLNESARFLKRFARLLEREGSSHVKQDSRKVPPSTHEKQRHARMGAVGEDESISDRPKKSTGGSNQLPSQELRS